MPEEENGMLTSVTEESLPKCRICREQAQWA